MRAGDGVFLGGSVELGGSFGRRDERRDVDGLGDGIGHGHGRDTATSGSEATGAATVTSARLPATVSTTGVGHGLGERDSRALFAHGDRCPRHFEAHPARAAMQRRIVVREFRG